MPSLFIPPLRFPPEPNILSPMLNWIINLRSKFMQKIVIDIYKPYDCYHNKKAIKLRIKGINELAENIPPHQVEPWTMKQRICMHQILCPSLYQHLPAKLCLLKRGIINIWMMYTHTHTHIYEEAEKYYLVAMVRINSKDSITLVLYLIWLKIHTWGSSFQIIRTKT